jgi:cytochrome c-type biogenesis protein
MSASGRERAVVVGPDLRRGIVYGVFLLLMLSPLVVFGIAGSDATSFDLRGGAGPAVAFSAGVLSFLSPCVLPMVPIFVSNLAGASLDGEGNVSASRGRMFGQGLSFMVGLSAVFVVLGASVGLIGFTLIDRQRDLEQGAGLLMMVLGVLVVPDFGRRSFERSVVLLVVVAVAAGVLVELAQVRGDTVRTLLLLAAMTAIFARFAGFLPGVSVFMRTFQFNPGTRQSAGFSRSLLIGGAFGLGWTPCVGPILGAILTLAAVSASAWTGAYLLLAYALGLSIPFLLAALAVGDATAGIRRLRRYLPLFEVAAAVMMVGLGILLFSGRLTQLNGYFGFADFNQGL